MNAPFSIGQKVVRLAPCSYIKKGGVYTIRRIELCKCQQWRVALIEDPRNFGDEYQCERCLSDTGDLAYLAKYFAPIQTNYADATAEILEKFKPSEDTPDKIIKPIPIKI